jgi:hypothetical protein
MVVALFGVIFHDTFANKGTDSHFIN